MGDICSISEKSCNGNKKNSPTVHSNLHTVFHNAWNGIQKQHKQKRSFCTKPWGYIKDAKKHGKKHWKDTNQLINLKTCTKQRATKLYNQVVSGGCTSFAVPRIMPKTEFEPTSSMVNASSVQIFLLKISETYSAVIRTADKRSQIMAFFDGLGNLFTCVLLKIKIIRYNFQRPL